MEVADHDVDDCSVVSGTTSGSVHDFCHFGNIYLPSHLSSSETERVSPEIPYQTYTSSLFDHEYCVREKRPCINSLEEFTKSHTANKELQEQIQISHRNKDVSCTVTDFPSAQLCSHIPCLEKDVPVPYGAQANILHCTDLEDVIESVQYEDIANQDYNEDSESVISQCLFGEDITKCMTEMCEFDILNEIQSCDDVVKFECLQIQLESSERIPAQAELSDGRGTEVVKCDVPLMSDSQELKDKNIDITVFDRSNNVVVGDCSCHEEVVLMEDLDITQVDLFASQATLEGRCGQGQALVTCTGRERVGVSGLKIHDSSHHEIVTSDLDNAVEEMTSISMAGHLLRSWSGVKGQARDNDSCSIASCSTIPPSRHLNHAHHEEQTSSHNAVSASSYKIASGTKEEIIIHTLNSMATTTGDVQTLSNMANTAKDIYTLTNMANTAKDIHTLSNMANTAKDIHILSSLANTTEEISSYESEASSHVLNTGFHIEPHEFTKKKKPNSGPSKVLKNEFRSIDFLSRCKHAGNQNSESLGYNQEQMLLRVSSEPDGISEQFPCHEELVNLSSIGMNLQTAGIEASNSINHQLESEQTAELQILGMSPGKHTFSKDSIDKPQLSLKCDKSDGITVPSPTLSRSFDSHKFTTGLQTGEKIDHLQWSETGVSCRGKKVLEHPILPDSFTGTKPCSETKLFNEGVTEDRKKLKTFRKQKVQCPYLLYLRRLVELYDRLLHKMGAGCSIDGKRQLQKFEQIIRKLKSHQEGEHTRLLSSSGPGVGLEHKKKLQELEEGQALLSVAMEKHEVLTQRVLATKPEVQRHKADGVCVPQFRTCTSFNQSSSGTNELTLRPEEVQDQVVHKGEDKAAVVAQVSGLPALMAGNEGCVMPTVRTSDHGCLSHFASMHDLQSVKQSVWGYSPVLSAVPAGKNSRSYSSAEQPAELNTVRDVSHNMNATSDLSKVIVNETSSLVKSPIITEVLGDDGTCLENGKNDIVLTMILLKNSVATAYDNGKTTHAINVSKEIASKCSMEVFKTGLHRNLQQSSPVFTEKVLEKKVDIVGGQKEMVARGTETLTRASLLQQKIIPTGNSALSPFSAAEAPTWAVTRALTRDQKQHTLGQTCSEVKLYPGDIPVCHKCVSHNLELVGNNCSRQPGITHKRSIETEAGDIFPDKVQVLTLSPASNNGCSSQRRTSSSCTVPVRTGSITGPATGSCSGNIAPAEHRIILQPYPQHFVSTGTAETQSSDVNKALLWQTKGIPKHTQKKIVAKKSREDTDVGETGSSRFVTWSLESNHTLQRCYKSPSAMKPQLSDGVTTGTNSQSLKPQVMSSSTEGRPQTGVGPQTGMVAGDTVKEPQMKRQNVILSSKNISSLTKQKTQGQTSSPSSTVSSCLFSICREKPQRIADHHPPFHNQSQGIPPTMNSMQYQITTTNRPKTCQKLSSPSVGTCGTSHCESKGLVLGLQSNTDQGAQAHTFHIPDIHSSSKQAYIISHNSDTKSEFHKNIGKKEMKKRGRPRKKISADHEPKGVDSVHVTRIQETDESQICGGKKSLHPHTEQNISADDGTVAKANKTDETFKTPEPTTTNRGSTSVSLLISRLQKVLLVSDEEVIGTSRDIPPEFWDEDFANITMSESFWNSVDSW